MNSEFEYLEDKDIVLVRTVGSNEFSTEIDTVNEVASNLKKHNCNRLLFDFRASNLIANTMDIFDRPEIYGSLGIERSIKSAIVVKELNANMRFYETVCQNRSWNFKIFDDYDASIDWLTT